MCIVDTTGAKLLVSAVTVSVDWTLLLLRIECSQISHHACQYHDGCVHACLAAVSKTAGVVFGCFDPSTHPGL